jgi:hypothetical protein
MVPDAPVAMVGDSQALLLAAVRRGCDDPQMPPGSDCEAEPKSSPGFFGVKFRFK